MCAIGDTYNGLLLLLVLLPQHLWLWVFGLVACQREQHQSISADSRLDVRIPLSKALHAMSQGGFRGMKRWRWEGYTYRVVVLGRCRGKGRLEGSGQVF